MTRIVRLHADDRREIIGLASVDCRRLFVLHSPNDQKLEVYDATTFSFLKSLTIAGLSDHWDNELTACVTDQCLYVTDYLASTVYKIEVAHDNNVTKWRVDGEPKGLSMNAACNIMLSCSYKLLEYTPNGCLLREVHLQSMDPWHAIQLTNNQLVVSTLSNDVVEMNTEGRAVINYKYLLRSTTQHQFSVPCHLAVDKNCERIFVADYGNDRIVVLNRALKCARELNASVDGNRWRRPRCLHLNPSTSSCLYVGEGLASSHIFVFDIRYQ